MPVGDCKDNGSALGGVWGNSLPLSADSSKPTQFGSGGVTVDATFNIAQTAGTSAHDYLGEIAVTSRANGVNYTWGVMGIREGFLCGQPGQVAPYLDLPHLPKGTFTVSLSLWRLSAGIWSNVPGAAGTYYFEVTAGDPANNLGQLSNLGGFDIPVDGTGITPGSEQLPINTPVEQTGHVGFENLDRAAGHDALAVYLFYVDAPSGETYGYASVMSMIPPATTLLFDTQGLTYKIGGGINTWYGKAWSYAVGGGASSTAPANANYVGGFVDVTGV